MAGNGPCIPARRQSGPERRQHPRTGQHYSGGNV